MSNEIVFDVSEYLSRDDIKYVLGDYIARYFESNADKYISDAIRSIIYEQIEPNVISNWGEIETKVISEIDEISKYDVFQDISRYHTLAKSYLTKL